MKKYASIGMVIFFTIVSVVISNIALSKSKSTRTQPIAETPQAVPETPNAPKTVATTTSNAKPRMPSQNAVQPYVNSKYGFEITPPKDWTLDESGDADTVAYFINPTKDHEGSYEWQASINLGVNSGNSGFSMSEYMLAYKQFMQQSLQQYVATDERTITINGHEAAIISGTFVQEGHRFRNYQLNMLEGDNSYVASAVVLDSTWSKYEDAITASVGSYALQK